MQFAKYYAHPHHHHIFIAVRHFSHQLVIALQGEEVPLKKTARGISQFASWRVPSVIECWRIWPSHLGNLSIVALMATLVRFVLALLPFSFTRKVRWYDWKVSLRTISYMRWKVTDQYGSFWAGCVAVSPEVSASTGQSHSAEGHLFPEEAHLCLNVFLWRLR